MRSRLGNAPPYTSSTKHKPSKRPSAAGPACGRRSRPRGAKRRSSPSRWRRYPSCSSRGMPRSAAWFSVCDHRQASEMVGDPAQHGRDLLIAALILGVARRPVENLPEILHVNAFVASPVKSFKSETSRSACMWSPLVVPVKGIMPTSSANRKTICGIVRPCRAAIRAKSPAAKTCRLEVTCG